MNIRVPLVLSISDAVVYRLSTSETRADNPPGAATSGYDDAFREPVVYDTTQGASIGDRVVDRIELDPIRIPCQVETTLFESLAMAYQGNLQQGEMALVFDISTLQLLGLIDSNSGKPVFGVGDRVSAIEKHNMPGVNSVAFAGDGMYFKEVFPASWGFNESYNLWVGIIVSRNKGTT